MDKWGMGGKGGGGLENWTIFMEVICTSSLISFLYVLCFKNSFKAIGRLNCLDISQVI